MLCSFLRCDGLHLAFLAISGIDDTMSVLKSDSRGNLVIDARNDSPDAATATILVSLGADYECAVAALMYHARGLVQADLPTATEVSSEGETKPYWTQKWYDGLTYCTWNSLGQRLSEDLIFDALETLKQNDIKGLNNRALGRLKADVCIVSNVIIDDNWQTLVTIPIRLMRPLVDCCRTNMKDLNTDEGGWSLRQTRRGSHGVSNTPSAFSERGIHMSIMYLSGTLWYAKRSSQCYKRRR